MVICAKAAVKDAMRAGAPVPTGSSHSSLPDARGFVAARTAFANRAATVRERDQIAT
jgi:hypothetical protein